MLCFDDGYKSNTYYAAPILREFGFQATVFAIIGGYMGSYQEVYDSDTLQKITPEDLLPNIDVIDQQCHTYENHNHLPEQSYEQIYNDLVIAQNSYHCDYFAYPYGDYDAEVINAVKAAGFLAAVTTEERNAVPGDKIYEIPRYTVTSPMSDSDYLKLIGKAG
jgi:peptidoglycan/xylan/chitin deacetylase (PgdA/CDA1 family)